MDNRKERLSIHDEKEAAPFWRSLFHEYCSHGFAINSWPVQHVSLALSPRSHRVPPVLP